MALSVKIQPIGVKVEELTKTFLTPGKDSAFTAVDNVSLEVAPGELVTLLGPSGCGKTTILRMLSGFTTPTSGKILLGGKDMTGTPPNKRNVGMMFQSYALFPHLTIRENVAYGLKIKKVPKKELCERVDAILDMMQITELQDRIPEKVSGGQQQRVALARAVVTEPKILLFDEPLSNLDAKMREYMRDELHATQQRLGITSVYVTHDQEEAMAISDRIIIMNHGVIEQVGAPMDIYIRPNNMFVSNFMGKANFADGVIKSVDGKTATVEVMQQLITVSADQNTSLSSNKKVTCMIRPEFLYIDPNGHFNATVKRVTYLGSSAEYELEILGESLIMIDSDLHKNPLLSVGGKVNISMREQSVRILAHE